MTCTPQTNATLSEIADKLAACDDFVICGHMSPDGDCVGSQLALAHALRRLGKTVTCVLVSNEKLDPTLTFLPGADELIYAGAFRGVCRTFVGVDVPNRERIGQAAEKLFDKATTTITIDHHAYDTRMSQLAYVEPDSASTTMLVWEVAKLLGERKPDGALPFPGITTDIAQCALCGLMTDTGGFRYQNADVRSFKAASEMVSCGAMPSDIAREAFQNRSIPSLKLEALAIDRMEVFADGACVISWVSFDDMCAVGATKSDSEPLINTLRTVRGAEVACMLRDQRSSVKGSLRAKGDVDVNKIAALFGGGGHKAAAGFTVDLPFHKAYKKVVEALEHAVREQVGECGQVDAQ